MDQQLALKKSLRLLVGAPFLFMGLFLFAGCLALVNIKHPHMGWQVAIGLVAFACIVLPFYALGRAASLLGSSWVYFGLVPIFFVPVGLLVSWVILLEKWKKHRSSLAQGSLDQRPTSVRSPE
jgi:hypothetical protein